VTPGDNAMSQFRGNAWRRSHLNDVRTDTITSKDRRVEPQIVSIH